MRYRRIYEEYRERAIEDARRSINKATTEGIRFKSKAERQSAKALKRAETEAAKAMKKAEMEANKAMKKAETEVTKAMKKAEAESLKARDHAGRMAAKAAFDKKNNETVQKIRRNRKTLHESLNDLFSLLRFNITFKLTMNNLLALIILASIFGYLLATTLTYVRYTESNLEFKDVTNYLYESITSPDAIRDDDFRGFAKANRLEYAIRDNTGRYLYLTQAYDSDIARGYGFFDFILAKAPAYLYSDKLVTLEGKTYSLIFFKPFGRYSVYMDGFYQLVLGLGNCMIIIFAIWSNGITKRTLQPIKGMTHTVQDITVQSLNKRIDITGTKDELRDLAVTFNGMMDHIQSSYEKQKQFVSDASHELRTPIAIIQGYVGMLERWGKNDPEILAESIDAIRDESHNMQSLVEKLLFIARSEKGKIEYEMEIIECHSLLYAMVNDFSMIDPGHQFTVDCPFTGKIVGNRDALIQLFRIFIDNSIKYTPEGGNVWVRCFEQDQKVVVEIEDDGIGISPEDLPRIFDRFFRADKSRTRIDEKAKGFGLGLSIARIILEAHGAVAIPSSELNKGTKMQIVFSTVVTDET